MAGIASSRIKKVESSQLFLLIPYTAVTLGEHRAEIMNAVYKVFENICIGYIKRRLVHLCQKQERLLKEANESVDKMRRELAFCKLGLNEPLSELSTPKVQCSDYADRFKMSTWLLLNKKTEFDDGVVATGHLMKLNSITLSIMS